MGGHPNPAIPAPGIRQGRGQVQDWTPVPPVSRVGQV